MILAVQKEVTAEVDKSNVSQATGGGVLPYLIDVAVERSRTSSAETALRPIRDALVDYDVGAELQHALNTRLKTIPWLHVKKVDVVYDNKPKPIPALLAASSEDALLLVTPSYALSSNFSDLRFETEVRVVPRAAHLMPADAGDDADKRMVPLYKTRFAQHTSVTVPGNLIENAHSVWAGDGDKRIKQALHESVRLTADQIIEALSHPERAP